MIQGGGPIIARGDAFDPYSYAEENWGKRFLS